MKSENENYFIICKSHQIEITLFTNKFGVKASLPSWWMSFSACEQVKNGDSSDECKLNNWCANTACLPANCALSDTFVKFYCFLRWGHRQYDFVKAICVCVCVSMGVNDLNQLFAVTGFFKFKKKWNVSHKKQWQMRLRRTNRWSNVMSSLNWEQKDMFWKLLNRKMTSVFLFVFLINETTKLQTNISKYKGKKMYLRNDLRYSWNKRVIKLKVFP